MKALNFFLSVFIMGVLTYSCSNSNDNRPQEKPLENVTHNVLFWEFTPDTGNNTSRLRYKIEFHNPNDATINGFYQITQKADVLETTLFSSNKPPCYKIEANSSCTLSFNEEESFDLAKINAIDLISVGYDLEE